MNKFLKPTFVEKVGWMRYRFSNLLFICIVSPIFIALNSSFGSPVFFIASANNSGGSKMVHALVEKFPNESELIFANEFLDEPKLLEPDQDAD